MSMRVRPAAVAGTFYPGSALELRDTVRGMMKEASVTPLSLAPRIVIVPHAGYIYSGSVAATAYRIIADQSPSRIALVGPSHFVGFDGLAIPAHDWLATPLGTIAIDELAQGLAEDGLVARSEPAHRREHSLEVQLPFLQVALEEFSVVPVLTGDEHPERAAKVLSLMLEADLFVVVSSDLSHYQDYETAGRLDAITTEAIVELREADLGRHSACGRTAVRAALRVAIERGWRCQLLDLRSSGDTAGPRDRVVGYGAFALGPADSA